MTGARRKLGHYSDDAEALEFVGSAKFEELAALGTSCPDHFLRTKIAPLTLDPARLQDDAYLAQKIADYRDFYAAYYERCKRANSPAMRDPNPVVVLVPGVGRITFATDKTTARLAGEFYGNAINVMRGAEAIGDYIALDEQEAFDIEYWLLEEAKLQRMPAPKPRSAARWSPAAPAASARRRPPASCAKAPAWCWPTATLVRPKRCAPALPSSSARTWCAPWPAT
jgi:hypothetical protein